MPEPHIWKNAGTPVKTRTKALIFLKKIVKKCLTKEERFGILVKLAYGEPEERAKRTLKTIQNKERAIKEEDSEDSKEFSTERC